MDLTLTWPVEAWKAFYIWASTQPTFIQVAFGMGLFYLVLLLCRLSYRVTVYILSGLFTGRGKSRKQRDVKPANRSKKHVTVDDDAPPFVFR